MIKLVYCLTRKSGMSRAAFFDYWEKTHAPIGARIPGLRKFVQSRALEIEGNKPPPDFDGMVELWFDDVPALLAARRSPEWAASTADEKHFVDPKGVAYFVSEEKQII